MPTHPPILLALLLLAWTGSGLPSAQPDPPRPNLVVVFIDDMGWGDLSCFGNTEAETEHIDRLAEEGLRFEQFYVSSPICSPSRVGITTGQYPWRWRIGSYLGNREQNGRRGIAQWLDPSAPTVARMLRGAGYATAHFGKWHMGGQRDVGDAPLVEQYGFDESLTNFEGLGPRLLPLLDAYDGSHARRHALGSDRLGAGPIRWEERARITGAFCAAAIDFMRRIGEQNDSPFYFNLWPDDVHSPFFPPKDRRGDGSKRARFLGVLETMDEQLGVLFDRIRDDEALRDNTLIVLCSDNGPEKGAGSAGPFRGYKTHLFEGGIRSPLIVWGPGLVDAERAGSVDRSSVISAMDLVPSLLAIAGAEAPDGVSFDGEDLHEVLLGRSQRSRTAPLFFRRPPDRDAYYGVDDLPDLAVREDRWKLLCEFDGSDAVLFDLAEDPGETHDQAEAEPELASRLVEAALAWHRSLPSDAGDPRPERDE